MNKPRALIVEDDPKLGEIYQLALQQAGFDAALDQTARNFTARLATPAPALVILDIHLPYASGIEIFEQIRAHAEWGRAVIIVTTADLFLAKTLEGKADYVLLKPVSLSRITSIVSARWNLGVNLETDPA
jgi:DNA-binding response OmpR family regulator